MKQQQHLINKKQKQKQRTIKRVSLGLGKKRVGII